MEVLTTGSQLGELSVHGAFELGSPGLDQQNFVGADGLEPIDQIGRHADFDETPDPHVVDPALALLLRLLRCAPLLMVGFSLFGPVANVPPGQLRRDLYGALVDLHASKLESAKRDENGRAVGVALGNLLRVRYSAAVVV